MFDATRKTAFRLRLAIAAWLLSGLAGCQADCCRPAWQSIFGCGPRASCRNRNCGECAPSGAYQPTVWESWRDGPMAMRCRPGESSTQAVPDWLNDLPNLGPRPSGAPASGSRHEVVPAPADKTEETPKPKLGSGFQLQPPADQTPAASENNSRKPDLGGGFKLQPPANPPKDIEGVSKPALKGLETLPEKPLPPKLDRDGPPSLSPAPDKGPAALPPQLAPPEKGPVAPPNLLPAAPPNVD